MHRGLLKFFIIAVLATAALPGAAGAAAAGQDGWRDAPRLVVNGEVVRGDVPPRIVGDRLLVPLRLIAERLGLAVVWRQDEKKVTLQGDGTVVALTIGRREAVVNGREVRLDLPPLLVDDRTLVPLRFVSEVFGARVEWDGTRRTAAVTRPVRLRGISFDPAPGGGTLRITASGPVRPAGPLSGGEGGERLVLDLPHVEVPPQGIVMVGTGPVRLVRAAGVPGPPPSARLVIDLARGAEGVLGEAPAPGQLLIEVRASDRPEAGGTLPATRPDAPAPGPAGRPVVVLDPGHGGSDPGAPGPGSLEEKDIALAIARKARALLDEAGLRVVLTRDGDRTIGLYERAAVPGRVGAALFVSIHANASPLRSTAGIETYYYPGSPAGRRLAAVLQRTLVSRLGRPDRGVQAADFVVVREPAVPAALVECGYLTNREEARLLASEDYQLRVARAIADGVLSYLRPGDSG